MNSIKVKMLFVVKPEQPVEIICQECGWNAAGTVYTTVKRVKGVGAATRVYREHTPAAQILAVFEIEEGLE